MAKPKAPAGEMPFLDHLEELRWRIIYSLIGVCVGLAVGLYCAFKFELIDVLQAPLLPYLKGHRLVITHPMDAFTIHIQLAFAIGLTVAAPVVFTQLWAFLSPALYKTEKRVVIPVLVAGAFLFLCGAALAWFFVLPMSLKWLYGLLGEALEPMYSASEYFSFVTNMVLAFGLSFEVPLLLVALSALGILSARTLNKSRKFAVLIVFVAAAILSPGDAIVATIAMAVPLYLLYEVSIVAAYVIERRRARRRDEEELAAPA